MHYGEPIITESVRRKLGITLIFLALLFLVVAVVLWIMQKFPNVLVAMFYSFLSMLMACVLFDKGAAAE